jgi:hypothetical protein
VFGSQLNRKTDKKYEACTSWSDHTLDIGLHAEPRKTSCRGFLRADGGEEGLTLLPELDELGLKRFDTRFDGADRSMLLILHASVSRVNLGKRQGHAERVKAEEKGITINHFRSRNSRSRGLPEFLYVCHDRPPLR